MKRKVGKYLIEVPREMNVDNFFKWDIYIVEPSFVAIRGSEMDSSIAEILRYSETEKEVEAALRAVVHVREHQLNRLKDLLK